MQLGLRRVPPPRRGAKAAPRAHGAPPWRARGPRGVVKIDES